MAGSNRQTNKAAGVYPGSGVARGGQVGRSNVIHNGIGGARAGGGVYSAGSVGKFRAANGASWSFRNAQGNIASHVKGPSGSQKVIQNRGWKAPNAHGPAYNKPAGPDQFGSVVNPVVGSPAGPAVTDPYLSDGHDGQWALDNNDLQNQYDNTYNPAKAEYDGLAVGGAGNTMYDKLLAQAQGAYGRSVLSARDAASKRGLLVSGSWDQGRADLGNEWTATQGDLRGKYDSRDITGSRGHSLLAAMQAAATARTRGLGAINAAAAGRHTDWLNNQATNTFNAAAQQAQSVDPYAGLG